jgi:hypothetical protein
MRCERLGCGWKIGYKGPPSRRFTCFPVNQRREAMEGLRDGTVKEAEDDVETERVLGLVMKAVEGDLREVAKAIVSKPDNELLGPGEFDLRDRVLKAACHVLEAVLHDRKKGATEAAARIALAVGPTRGSSSGGRRRS